ncbi:MAG: PadR family transcriptional regulator [Pseudonocardiales bacterium]|nr:MAG: PadR family transcriptional regulator [Pseudonocardiales bacterium]
MKADAIRGHLDGLVLAVLEGRPLHGYGVVQALHVRSGGALDVPTGTVYPALHRLERSGLISAKEHTVAGRRRRVYQLTASGRRALNLERSSWQEFATVITAMIQQAPS